MEYLFSNEVVRMIGEDMFDPVIADGRCAKSEELRKWYGIGMGGCIEEAFRICTVVVYRDDANPGFHEAVGNLIRMSFGSPKNLFNLGVLKELHGDNETDISFLMDMTLNMIDNMSFAYMLDKWRWSVFRGSTSPNNYTRDYWDLRCRYQGVSPPVARTENDFDPGAYYHTVVFMPYFREMLRRGSSKPWPDAMKVLTGHEKMDASALPEYFKPLHDYLIQKNAENGEKVGWQAFCPDNQHPCYNITLTRYKVLFNVVRQLLQLICNRKSDLFISLSG